MWFLISHLSPRQLPGLIGKTQDEVQVAVLDALEQVVRETPLTAALKEAVCSMPFLTPEQRELLNHGLEHASQGEWLQAVPPLIIGFEGGLHSSAVDASLLPATERGKLPAAEAVIRKFEFDEAFEAFTLRLVFGGGGNSFRHGRPNRPAREQLLWMLVAMVAWVDFILDTRGLERLAEELHGSLKTSLGPPRPTPALNSRSPL